MYSLLLFNVRNTYCNLHLIILATYIAIYSHRLKSGLQSLVTRFEEERIDGNVALTLSDGELKRLGIDTIGDKYRIVLPLPRNTR